MTFVTFNLCVLLTLTFNLLTFDLYDIWLLWTDLWPLLPLIFIYFCPWPLTFWPLTFVYFWPWPLTCFTLLNFDLYVLLTLTFDLWPLTSMIFDHCVLWPLTFFTFDLCDLWPLCTATCDLWPFCFWSLPFDSFHLDLLPLIFDLFVLLTFDLWPFLTFDLFLPLTFDLKLVPWHFMMWCCVTVMLLFQCFFSNIYRSIAVWDMIHIIDITEVMFWLPPFATAFLMQCCKAEFLLLWCYLSYFSMIYRLKLN